MEMTAEKSVEFSVNYLGGGKDLEVGDDLHVITEEGAGSSGSEEEFKRY